MTNGAQSAGPAAAARAISMSGSSNSQGYSPVLDTPDEEMVKDEMEDPGSDTDRIARSLGVLHVNNNNSTYVGDAHWAAILHDVSAIVYLMTTIFWILICFRSRKSVITSQSIRSYTRTRS